MPNSLHTNKIKDEKDAFVNELFNMIPKREELISGEASAIATLIHKFDNIHYELLQVTKAKNRLL